MITRRAFIAALMVSPTLARAGGLGAGNADFADLLRQFGGVADISQTLLTAAEYEFATRYGALAAGALVDALSNGALDVQLESADEAARDQVKFITRFLYTGEVTEKGVTTSPYYPWCLAWQALTFATAPGLCGDQFGRWADAPVTGGA